MIRSDMKTYKEGKVRFAIGQVEVTNIAEAEEIRDKYIEALEIVRKRDGLDWCMLLITDVIRGSSVLLSSDYPLVQKLAYDKLADGMLSLPGVLSRKKQLLPEILRVVSGE